MSTRFELRKAEAGDAPAACQLLRCSIEQGCQAEHRDDPVLLGAWLGNKTPENVRTWFASAANYALVAESAGQLLGLGLLTQAGKVALCYVHPDCLRQGIGRELLAALEQQARAWDIGRLHLQSPVSASGFFERHGYINGGKDTACFGLPCEVLFKRIDGQCEAATQGGRKRFCQCGA